jgi:hypothetical protein
VDVASTGNSKRVVEPALIGSEARARGAEQNIKPVRLHKNCGDSVL